MSSTGTQNGPWTKSVAFLFCICLENVIIKNKMIHSISIYTLDAVKHVYRHTILNLKEDISSECWTSVTQMNDTTAFDPSLRFYKEISF